MFYSIVDLVEQASTQYEGNVAELMIATEFELTGREREEVLRLMTRNLEVMIDSVRLGLNENHSRSGLTGGDAAKLDRYIKSGKTLSDLTVLTAAKNAIAVNEHNAKMGLVCATPTAGSAGCLPAVLTAATQKLGLNRQQQLDFLLTAGAFGLVIANNASISGAEGGCQAEVGSASAMSAAALTLAAGGTPYQASQAVCFVIKNMLGLICDPVAGLVEVPCVKRNAMGASYAFIAADMALAGIESKIPVDEVIDAMYQVGSSLPTAFRETAEGGLAATPTGRDYKKRYLENNMQALFFDLDGTLVDSSKGITESFQHTFDTLKVPQPDLKTIRSFMGPPLISSFEATLPETLVDQAVTIYRQYYHEKVNTNQLCFLR